MQHTKFTHEVDEIADGVMLVPAAVLLVASFSDFYLLFPGVSGPAQWLEQLRAYPFEVIERCSGSPAKHLSLFVWALILGVTGGIAASLITLLRKGSVHFRMSLFQAIALIIGPLVVLYVLVQPGRTGTSCGLYKQVMYFGQFSPTFDAAAVSACVYLLLGGIFGLYMLTKRRDGV